MIDPSQDPFGQWDWWDREILPLVRQGPVLDLGAGAGRASLYLQERGLRVTAAEASPGAAEVCRRRGVAGRSPLDWTGLALPSPGCAAAAFGVTFWWILAFAGVTLIPILFLPGRARERSNLPIPWRWRHDLGAFRHRARAAAAQRLTGHTVQAAVPPVARPAGDVMSPTDDAHPATRQER